MSEHEWAIFTIGAFLGAWVGVLVMWRIGYWLEQRAAKPAPTVTQLVEGVNQIRR